MHAAIAFSLKSPSRSSSVSRKSSSEREAFASSNSVCIKPMTECMTAATNVIRFPEQKGCLPVLGHTYHHDIRPLRRNRGIGVQIVDDTRERKDIRIIPGYAPPGGGTVSILYTKHVKHKALHPVRHAIISLFSKPVLIPEQDLIHLAVSLAVGIAYLHAIGGAARRQGIRLDDGLLDREDALSMSSGSGISMRPSFTARSTISFASSSSSGSHPSGAKTILNISSAFISSSWRSLIMFLLYMLKI